MRLEIGRHRELAFVLGCFVAIWSACDWGGIRTAGNRVRDIQPVELYVSPIQRKLAIAVDQDDRAGVDAAVAGGADVNARGKNGYSLLYWAMMRGRVAGFESLVKNGADVTVQCRDSAKSEHQQERDFVVRLALDDEKSAFLEAMLRQGFDPNYVLDATTNESLVVLASRRHSQRVIDLLLHAGADVDLPDASGYAAISVAVLRRDYKTAWFLLDRGANPRTGWERKNDAVSMLKDVGSRGVRPDQEPYFEKLVAELVSRGLLTRQDILEADKPKASVLGGRTGVTVIEHPAGSEAGRAIRQLDALERQSRDGEQR